MAHDSGGAAVLSLRKALEAGVFAFDLSGSKDPAGAERILTRAFPEPGPELLVLAGVGRSRSGMPGPANGPREFEPAGEPVDAFDDVRRLSERLRLRRPPVLMLPTLPTDLAQRSRWIDGLERMCEEQRIEDWAVRWDPRGPGPGPEGHSPRLLYSPASLLDRRVFDATPSAIAPGADGLFITDPFAGGMLDGRRFSSSLSNRRPLDRPPDLRGLEARFGPVLALRYLTDGTGRTLTDAALRYLLQKPKVVSVILPLPPPEDLDRILSFEERPPLTAAEIARIDRP